MATHSVDASSLKTSADASIGRNADIASPPGFRHFLGSPLPSQRFRVFGVDPLQSPAHLPDIRALMNRLSRRMDAEIRWPQHQH
jgi:hypothetical protein